MELSIASSGLNPQVYPVRTQVGGPVALPTTEATADANTFVCEFLGGSSANETGVGLGLSGADLVFTQVGSVPAASSGYRALNGTSQYFTGTAAFAAAWAAQSEWTYALKLKSLTAASGKRLWVFATSTANLSAQSVNASGRYALGSLGGDTPILAAASAIASTSSAIWACSWLNGGVLHFGWVQQESLPTGWDEFPALQRSSVRYGSTIPGPYTTIDVAGSNVGYPAVSVGIVVASKIGLAAAPV